MYLAPIITRLRILWMLTMASCAVMIIGARYNSWRVVEICWLSLVVLFVFATRYLDSLRP
jgi:hypothetical protein